MVNFDSPNREKCAVFENRTNSPLQALDLMNDVTFLEAARKLAERMMTEGGATPQAADRVRLRAGAGAPARAAAGARCSRAPSTVRGGVSRAIRSRGGVSASRESRRVRDGLIAAELAAYTGVASLILNMDEAITKE